MNTSIVGKQFDLTEPIKAYIEGAVDALGKYNLDIISVRTVIAADEKNGKKGFNVEFAINMAHKNTIVIQQKDKDVYAAVDLAIERAKKVLRRHHDKIKQSCLIRFEKIFKDEEFLATYDLQRKRLQIDIDNAFVVLYKRNNKKILPL